jgi:hypothetical protein
MEDYANEIPLRLFYYDESLHCDKTMLTYRCKECGQFLDINPEIHVVTTTNIALSQ